VTAPSPLDRLTESYVDIRWHLDPVEGSGAGRSADDARLGSFGDESIRQHTAALRSLMTAVEELDVGDLDDEIDRTALLYDIRVAEHRYRREQPHRRDPGLWAGHVLEALYQLLVARDREPEALARAATARLRAIPRFLEDASATLTECPRVLTEGALAAVRPGAAVVDEVERALDRWAPGGDHATAAAGARDALVRFESHLSALLEASRPEEPWGVGREALEFRLAHQHALTASTEELLRYGGALIDETERELASVAGRLGGGSWPDVLARLREERVPGADLATAYTETMERARRHVGLHDLAAVPDGALEVALTPAYAVPWTPVAAYLPPGPLGRDRTGRFFVTPSDHDGTGDHPRASVASTAVHEGFPGHHLHLLTAYESPRLARRLLLAPMTVEGWALYCEGMMEETGFYVQEEERFFRLVALLWRALRIPVDVGVHTGALTFEAAVRLLEGRLHVPRARAEAEVRRAYAQPSALLAYAVGRRELLALRAAYQRRAGSARLRDFHDALLRFGALPPSLVRWGLDLGA
jgi:uncharacterized protein (DUF885 family)